MCDVPTTTKIADELDRLVREGISLMDTMMEAEKNGLMCDGVPELIIKQLEKPLELLIMVSLSVRMASAWKAAKEGTSPQQLTMFDLRRQRPQA